MKETVSLNQLPSYRTRSATLPRSEPLPTTTTGHYTTCCKKPRSCAPEDGQKFARNMLSWSLEINKTVIVASRWFLYYLTYRNTFSVLSEAMKNARFEMCWCLLSQYVVWREDGGTSFVQHFGEFLPHTLRHAMEHCDQGRKGQRVWDADNQPGPQFSGLRNTCEGTQMPSGCTDPSHYRNSRGCGWLLEYWQCHGVLLCCEYCLAGPVGPWTG